MNKTGVAWAAFFAACHAAWSLAVLGGVAQPALDWIFWLHFIGNPYSVQPFSAGRALGLVAFASAVGYALGWLFDACRERCRL